MTLHTLFAITFIQKKGENLLIAIQDELVCGCLFVTSKSDSYQKLYQTLRKFLSFSQCLKLIFLLSLLSHKPVQNERYIDFITVSPNFRGQGIGKNANFSLPRNFS